jgi:hypothetical protein
MRYQLKNLKQQIILRNMKYTKREKMELQKQLEKSYTWRIENCTNFLLATIGRNSTLIFIEFLPNNKTLQNPLHIPHSLKMYENFYLKYLHMLMIHCGYLRICR